MYMPIESLIETSSSHEKITFEIFVRFRCREKRKPNVGRGNILWL